MKVVINKPLYYKFSPVATRFLSHVIQGASHATGSHNYQVFHYGQKEFGRRT